MSQQFQATPAQQEQYLNQIRQEMQMQTMQVISLDSEFGSYYYFFDDICWHKQCDMYLVFEFFFKACFIRGILLVP